MKPSGSQLLVPASACASGGSEVDSGGFRAESACPVKKRDSLTLRRVGDELLLLDEERKRIHQLNQTATFIWDVSDRVADLAEIARLLADEFEVNEAAALKDVLEVVSTLRGLKLLVGE